MFSIGNNTPNMHAMRIAASKGMDRIAKAHSQARDNFKEKILAHIRSQKVFSNQDWYSIYSHDADMSAEIFYAAMQANLSLSNEIYELLAHFKDEIMTHIKLKPTNDMFAYQLLKGAFDLDENKNPMQPLGKIFWVKRGARACRVEAGTLKIAKEELDRRRQYISLSSASQSHVTLYGKETTTQQNSVEFGPQNNNQDHMTKLQFI